MLDPRFCSMLEVFMNLTNAPCWKFRFLPCLLVGMQLIVSGCELDGLSSSSDSGSAVITMNELNEVAVEPPASAEPASAPTDAEESSSPAAPAPAPAAQPRASFLWEPRANSVRVVIPSSLPHWRFGIGSRRLHHDLYGPDYSGGNREINMEYVLPGNGASWRQKSLNAGDDGTLMVFINTRDVETGSLKNAGWRIMDATRVQSGDGDRLKPGENR